MISRQILILNGSPKLKTSTTGVLAEFLKDKLIQQKVPVEVIRVSSCLKSENGVSDLIETVKCSDLLFLIFPLYIDSLPYNMIEALETIQSHLGSEAINRKKTLMALSHSGLDEAKNSVAVKVCRCFADELQFNFGGTLMLGFGGVLNGVPLTTLNRMTKRLQKSLELAANAIAAGESIPEAAQRLMSKPFLPGPLFLIKYLFNATMKSCYKEKDFAKGIKKLHSKLKIIYS